MKKVIKVCILVLLSINLALPSFAVNQNFKNFYNQGLQAFKTKNYTKAIYSFNNALKYNPTSYQTYCLLGISYGTKGDIKNAERVLQKAIKINPTSWGAYVFLADVKKAEKNYPVAIEYYTKAIGLKSMSASSKTYYKTVIAKTKQEQNKNNAQTSNITAIRNSVELNLDWQEWQKAYETGRDNNWIIEYGLKGQNVKQYQWTQLVTVQYYKTDSAASIENYFQSHIANFEKMAQTTHKSFVKTLISQNSNEIVYEWAYNKGQESEVSRIVKTEKGIYHLHFAKKGLISPDERNKWIDILKNAKINE